jgi:hypothetical protein
MMEAKVVVPVELDTRQAKTDLKKLHREKEEGFQRITSFARRTSRFAARGAAFTGVSSQLARFQNNEPSVRVTPLEEAMVPYKTAAMDVIGGFIGSGRAKRKKTAREETRAVFAYQVGRTGEAAGMHSFYATVQRMERDESAGRKILRQDPRFIGADIGTAAKAALKGNLALFLTNLDASGPVAMLRKAGDYMVRGITSE